jgi:hypothetical protein
LRVIDKRTGEEIHQIALGSNLSGGTMTYLMNGRQFVVAVVAGSQGAGAELVGLALPLPGGNGRGGRGGRGAAPPQNEN